MGARLRQVSLVLIGRNTPSLNLRVYERTGRVFPKAVIQRPMQQRPLTRDLSPWQDWICWWCLSYCPKHVSSRIVPSSDAI